ncbi:MAG: T9SS type A sorting domain-containing protein [Saprospiraceae bacterium]|nr:T9SS type A sorting domain-containing protein [Saprospiraceae bacterium]
MRHSIFTPILSGFLALLPFVVLGQWQWMQSIGGSGIDNSGGLVVAGENQNVYVAGVFAGGAWGGNDIFLTSLDNNGATTWSFNGGGPLDDEVTAVTSDASGNILVAGAYWLNASFAGVTLEAEQSSRSLFILNVSPEGTLQWAKNLHGTAIKKIGAIGADTAGNIYISGYFQGQLSLDEWVLEANGATDFFIARLNEDGIVTWAVHAGQTGDTRITAMAVKPGGGLVAGGYFNAITQIGDYQFTANTYDRDVFIASYDADGALLWARKAGGVHNDELTGIALDDEGTVYATGYLVGVMNLGEGITIQSANGNPDFYILKYNYDGLPLQARAMGGALRDQSMAIVHNEDGVALAGFFLDDMNIDGQMLENNGQTAGFILRFDESLALLQSETMHSDEGPVYAMQLAIDHTGKLVVAGSFEGTLQYGNAGLTAAGSADVFVGKWSPLSTSTDTPTSASPYLSVFPNPARGQFEITSPFTLQNIRIFDQQGKLIYNAAKSGLIAADNWPAGAYRIIAHTSDGRILETGLLIQR